MAPPRLWLSFLLGVLVVTGCPRRFDPRAAQLESLHSNNPEAEADYRTAHRKWQEGDLPGAAAATRQFLDKHGKDPAEPLLPLAQLLDARIARSQGELDRARDILRPLISPPASPAISELARFELGLVEYHRADYSEAQKLLVPFSGQIVEGDEATELHAVLADLYRRADQVTDAVREYEQFYRSPRVRQLEQAYIRTQVSGLLPRLSPNEQRDLRARFAIETAPAAGSGAGASPRLVVGMVLPLSGKERALGERVLRGALWGAQSLAARRGEAPGRTEIDLRVRDTGSSATGVAAAVAELQREGALAIIGSPVKAEAAAIAAEAERRGLLSLNLSASSLPEGATGRSLHLLRSNEARADSLAQYLKSGVSGPPITTVAVLAPATPYGQSMTRAFVAGLSGSRIQVVAQLTFPASTTTFTAQARQLLDLAPQAVFVPATAAQLELVAAQLAAVGALATYRVEKRESEPPVRLLLSSAEGMGDRLLKNVGRYLQGAVLAPISPGGVPVTGDPGRWNHYSEDGGSDPGALDALGYDAVALLRTAASCAGSCTADQLAASLHAANLDGATGPLSFDAAGQRGGASWLLRVEGSALRPVAVTATAPAAGAGPVGVDRRSGGVR